MGYSDMMDDVQEGTDQNKFNGYESANYLSLLMGDEVPVKAPEWIIHLPGMNEERRRYENNNPMATNQSTIT